MADTTLKNITLDKNNIVSVATIRFIPVPKMHEGFCF